jgi:FdhE protein
VDLTLWEGDQCPCCGGSPVISYFDKDGKRNLVCGSCYTAWRYRRIGCPFCGEQNHENLRVLETEDYPGWVAMVCKTCRGSIKTADLRKIEGFPDWNEAQINLLPLDFAVENWLNSPTSVS